jgi:integrase
LLIALRKYLFRLQKREMDGQMGSRASLRRFVVQRLDSLMAIKESRHQAKQAIREGSREKRWNVSTGKIHSYTTRTVYQQHMLAFVDWAIAAHRVSRSVDLDTHADEWGSEYLLALIEQGKSPSTLLTVRSALRLFFGPHIAASVVLPKRTRRRITRSRMPVKQDQHFQPKHWPEQTIFARATGLRRSEMRDLRVEDISQKANGVVSVHVKRGKGGKARDVTVLAGYETAILAMIDGRDPKEHVFPRIPKAMDVQSYRRASAQERYQQHAPGRALPNTQEKRISPKDYDTEAAQEVSEALGHSRRRRSIVLNHYLQ